MTILDLVSDFTPQDSNVELSWAPDGKAMAVVRNVVVVDSPGHGSLLYIVDADGTGLSAVPGVENAMDPSWRPE